MQPMTAKKSRGGVGGNKGGAPFPNFLLGEHEVPSICRCVFDGDKFYVINTKDMHLLNHNGSFGVSSLTYRGLRDEDEAYYLKPYYAKKLERESKKGRDEFFKLVDAGELPLNGKSMERKGFKSNINVNARNGHAPKGDDGLSESDEEDSRKSFLENLQINIDDERLILMPEEVIFLSFGVGCLTIHSSTGGAVGYRKLWRRLVETNPEFPILYAVYHYFRSKNWVPKLGNSYGASYLLYKVGPSAYHASYLVHILGFPSRPSPTWNEINAWVRLGCHVSKNVLLCEVSLPRRYDAFSSEPRTIFDMSLKETSLFRWKAKSGTTVKF